MMFQMIWAMILLMTAVLITLVALWWFTEFIMTFLDSVDGKGILDPSLEPFVYTGGYDHLDAVEYAEYVESCIEQRSWTLSSHGVNL